MMVSLIDYGTAAVSSTSLTLVTAATALVVAWVWLQQKPRKDFPPGPKGWPLVGNLLEFRHKAATDLFQDYVKEYGNVFSIRIGTRWTVVLNGAEVIKRALLKKGVEFAGRPTSFTMDVASMGGKSIVMGQYSPTWKLHRKLSYSAFRTLVNRDNERFEKLVYSILPGLSEQLDQQGTEPFVPRMIIASTIYNILATMCFGKQYEFGSPFLKEMMYLSQRGTELSGNGVVADFIPIFKYIPTPAVKEITAIFERFSNMIEEEMEEHRQKYNRDNEPADLVDLLLHARQEIVDEGEEDIGLVTDTHMNMTVADIFGAGTDTSIFTLLWSLGLLAEHPDVQAKVADEVDRVVGRDRPPSLADRENLPYTVAALYEVMRYSTLVPLAIPHATSKEVSFDGFTIPEGTWVFVNIHSMHFDEELWDEPKKFKPEHFLDESGGVRLHPEGFLPFSTGRRVCLGESIAKAELFLLFSWLFQHYEFVKPDDMKDRDYSEGVKEAIVHSPKDNMFLVKKRF